MNKKVVIYSLILATLFTIYNFKFLNSSKKEFFKKYNLYKEKVILSKNIEKISSTMRVPNIKFCKQKDKLICKNISKSQFQYIENRVFNTLSPIKSFSINKNSKNIDFYVEWE